MKNNLAVIFLFLIFTLSAEQDINKWQFSKNLDMTGDAEYKYFYLDKDVYKNARRDLEFSTSDLEYLYGSFGANLALIGLNNLSVRLHTFLCSLNSDISFVAHKQIGQVCNFFPVTPSDVFLTL